MVVSEGGGVLRENMKRGCKAETGYKAITRKIEQQGEEKCKTILRECVCVGA